MAPTSVAQLGPGLEIPLRRVYYRCHVDGGRPTEDLASRLRNLPAIELTLRSMCQNPSHNIHPFRGQQTWDSL